MIVANPTITPQQAKRITELGSALQAAGYVLAARDEHDIVVVNVATKARYSPTRELLLFVRHGSGSVGVIVSQYR